MKNYFGHSTILFVFFFLLSSTTRCQTYGQIFTKAEADTLFGSISISVSVPVSEIQNFLDQTNNVLMFKIKDGNLIVLGDGREPIYPSSDTVSVITTEIFKVYSKSIITELLNKGESGMVYIERRKSELTITFGGFTLEMGTFCPPFCQ